MAKTRGKNWASLATQDRPIPLTRPIRVECSLHEIRITDDLGRRIETRIPVAGDTVSAIDPFVRAIHTKVEGWGIAGDRMYWKPELVLTASADDTDRIVGLELGADDYMAKPYNPRELLARIKAIQRRMQAAGGNGPVRYLRFRDFCMDLTQRLLTKGEAERVVLTSMDFNLLRIFAEHAGETLERGRLMELTRGRDLGPLDRSLDVQISRLRQRLQDDSKQPELIKTVRGSGYVFSTDVSSHSEA